MIEVKFDNIKLRDKQLKSENFKDFLTRNTNNSRLDKITTYQQYSENILNLRTN